MAARIKQPGATGNIAGLCLAALLALGLPVQPIAAVDPQESVRAFYGVLLSNMRDGRMLGETGRYARLAPVVDRTFDIPSMTRLALGPTWGSLGPAQQQELIAAFAHCVAATYADQFDAYSGEQLEVTGERPYGTDLTTAARLALAIAT